MSAFVEAALREKLTAIRRQQIQKQVSEAAIDPLFLLSREKRGGEFILTKR